MSTILIIEDSPTTRRLIAVVLRALNVNILEAADGIEGINLAIRHLPALILLDIALPGIDGWQVLQHLRASQPTSDIKVMVLTAHAFHLAQQADQYGADDFMTKPFSADDLRSRVTSLLPAGTA